MNAPPPISWKELFELKRGQDFAVTMRILKKAGEPFLVLPKSSRLAAKALTLYPAQTRFARAAKSVFRTALQTRLAAPLNQTTIAISRDDPFARFLVTLANAGGEGLPPFAILCGNPRVEGRRFIVLLFDAAGSPSIVVKAGVGDSARRLVREETKFLRSVRSEVNGLPKILDSFVSDRIEAFAIDYIDGNSPPVTQWPDAGKLLTGWLAGSKRVSADEIPLWRNLAATHGTDTQFRRLSDALAGLKFSPPLHHGDFAPWNLKVSRTDGSWTAVDWERGELAGFPGWDWFHYAVQTGILVGKLPAPRLAQKLEELFAAPSFVEYARAAGIAGRERILAVAYIYHCAKVIRQTEGFASVESLLSLICERWL